MFSFDYFYDDISEMHDEDLDDDKLLNGVVMIKMLLYKNNGDERYPDFKYKMIQDK